MRITMLILAVLCLAVAAPALAGDEPAGKALFLENGCDMCHNITVVGIVTEVEEGEDPLVELSTVGDKHDAEFIMKFVTKQIEMNGEKHRKRFKGSDEELKTLADWLTTLKAPAD